MKQLPNTITYLLNSTPHGGKYMLRTSSSFWDTYFKRATNLINLFHDVYSGHCKKLAPEYEAAAEVLAAQDPPLTIAKVDATENKGLAERMEIKGFPTLYFWK